MDAVSSQRSQPSRVRPDAPVDVSLGAVPALVAVAALAVPLIVSGALICALVPVIPWWVGIIVGLVVAGLIVWQRLRRAHDLVVDHLTEAAATMTSVKLTNMVQGLALAAGVEQPAAFVLNDEAGNAMAICRNDATSLIVTSGLINKLDPVALEGLVAELLIRVRNGDAEAATIAAALYRLPIVGPWSIASVGPAAKLGMASLLAESRDLDADHQAVILTRYPPGLRRALTAARGLDRRPSTASAALDELWLVDPTDDRSALDLRIDVLTEL